MRGCMDVCEWIFICMYVQVHMYARMHWTLDMFVDNADIVVAVSALYVLSGNLVVN